MSGGSRLGGRAVLAAGVADAGLTSLANFVAGLYAVRTLEPAALGAYALVFAAFNLLSVVPAQLLFIPAETVAATFPPAERAGLATRWLLGGLAIGTLAAAVLPGWRLAAPGGIPAPAAAALTATAAVCAMISPVQDHLRRMLHVAGRSAGAVRVSGIHFAVVVAVVAAGWMLGVYAPWIPFGALALANVLSLLAGLVMLRGAGKAPRDQPELGAGALMRQGRWLVLASMIGPSAAFAAAGIVGQLAGVAALGLAEAARVIGGPVIVLATGLSAVLGPRSVRAARAGEPAQARRVAARFHAVVLAGGGGYLLIAGFGWAFNPLQALVPRAFTVPWLAAAAILGAIMHGGVFARRPELIGLGRASSIARIDVMGAALRVAVSASAALIGAFALPLALGLQAVYRRTAYRLALRGLYGPETVAQPHPPVPDGPVLEGAILAEPAAADSDG